MTSHDWRALVRGALENITGDPAHDEDIVEELAQHLAQRYDEHLVRGRTPDQALDLALAELSEPGSLTRSLRDAAPARPIAPVPPAVGGQPSVWNDFLQDLRYGARVLFRSRGFAVAAILTLAIGIGATTAIFSVVNTVLLQSVPLRDIDRMVMVWQTDRNTGTIREPSSLPDFLDVKERSRQLADAAGFIATEGAITPVDGDPVRVPVLLSTHGLLDLLGMAPAMGRNFTPEEDRPGQPPVALISDRVWERQFQRAPDVVGRTIRLNDVDFTIVGVVSAAADFGADRLFGRGLYLLRHAHRDNGRARHAHARPWRFARNLVRARRAACRLRLRHLGAGPCSPGPRHWRGRRDLGIGDRPARRGQSRRPGRCRAEVRRGDEGRHAA